MKIAGQHYGGAVLTMLCGLCVSSVLVIEYQLPCAALLPGVLAASLIRGLTAGVFTTVISVAFVFCFQLPPVGGFMISSREDLAVAAIFAGSSLLICLLVHSLQGAQRRALKAESEAELQIQLAELRREAEAQLVESEKRYRALFENSLEAIFLTRTSGAIVGANNAAGVLFNMSIEELRAKGRGGLVESNPRLAEALSVREKTGRARCEATCIRKDGSRFPAEMSSIVIGDEGEAYVIIRDLTLTKEAEAAARRFSQHLVSLKEDLSRRIARELHDDPAQLISALGLKLSYLCQHGKSLEQAALESELEDARELSREANRSLRGIMSELRPVQLDELGLPDAVSWHINQLRVRRELQVTLVSPNEFPRLPSDRETALFRIMQEALSNIDKHACARQATVSLEQSAGTVTLKVVDDGKGFDAAGATATVEGGWGLAIMRERAEQVGARLSIASSPGAGTTVLVTLGPFLAWSTAVARPRG